MDLVQTRRRSQLFEERSSFIRDASIDYGFSDTVEFYATSIWDQSLYKAWTQIIYFLIPNAALIESLLRGLCTIISARELILYERTTCLMVTHISSSSEHPNPFTDRFERISSILKTHKQSLAKHTQLPVGSANFAELQIKTNSFMFFITRLTENTNLAVCIPPSEQIFNAARINIALARPRFEGLDVSGKKNTGITGVSAGANYGDESVQGKGDESSASATGGEGSVRGGGDG
jgi:Ras-related GTP-binding protein A/B